MNKKQKLLIYTDNTIYGGSEKLMSFLIKNKAIRESYQITVVFRCNKVYLDAINLFFTEKEKEGLLFPATIVSNDSLFSKINSLELPGIVKKILKIPFYIVDNLGFYFVFNLLIQISLLFKFSPNIVHINNGGYPGASSCSTMVFASKLMGLPVIYQINNTALKARNIFQRGFDKYINSYVSSFITASKHSKEKLMKYRRFSSGKIILVPNTIIEDKITVSRENLLNELRIDQNQFIICNIGFLSKRKGQKHLIEAFNLIRTQDPLVSKKIHLLLVGNGEEESILKQNTENFNLNSSIHFLGYQSHAINYINCCDLFVFPSIYGEDMPLVILSAMSLGKSIIATDFAGIREEIENNRSGILIPTNPQYLSQILADNIIKLFYNREHKMGENAKKRYYELFSNSIYIKKILDIYNSYRNNKH